MKLTLEIAGGIVLGSLALAVIYGLAFLVFFVFEWVADELDWKKRRREYQREQEAKQKARANA